jgi:hypothetical protein
MRDHFFDSSDYSPRAVETVLGSYIMAVLFWNGTQLDMVVLLWNGGSSSFGIFILSFSACGEVGMMQSKESLISDSYAIYIRCSQ